MSEGDNSDSGAEKAHSQRETPKPRPPAERDVTEGYRPPKKPTPPSPPETPDQDE